MINMIKSSHTEIPGYYYSAFSQFGASELGLNIIYMNIINLTEPMSHTQHTALLPLFW